MKIISNYVDYYDSVEGNRKSPVYVRDTEILENAIEMIRADLLRAKIEYFPLHYCGDIWLVGHISHKSATDYIQVTPILVGIAGEYHYYIEYYNSVLNIRRLCYNYNELAQFYRNAQIKRTFDLYFSGMLNTYCRQQFGCVNFIMRKENTLTFIKEPCLSEFSEIDRFILTPQEMYSKIESFLIRTKELDKAYKKLKPTQFLTNKEKHKK